MNGILMTSIISALGVEQILPIGLVVAAIAVSGLALDVHPLTDCQ